MFLIICAIIAAVLWTLLYFFSVYPKEIVYIGIGTDDDEGHPRYLEFTKRKFVFYVVLLYVSTGALWTYFYYTMEEWEEMGTDDPAMMEDEKKDEDEMMDDMEGE